jgi:hypothetical protein
LQELHLPLRPTLLRLLFHSTEFNRIESETRTSIPLPRGRTQLSQSLHALQQTAAVPFGTDAVRELLDSGKGVLEIDIVRKLLNKRESSGTLKKDDSFAQLDKQPQQILLWLLAIKAANRVQEMAFGEFLELRESLKDKFEFHIQSTEPVLWIKNRRSFSGSLQSGINKKN